MGVDSHRLLLLRHGETEWSKTGRHTGRTDIELTAAGREQAEFAGVVLGELGLDDPIVICSPRRRTLVTADLAGLIVDQVTPLLAEWDYGEYEGLTTPQIRESDPDWLVWTHGCPGGETTAQVSERADRAIALALENMESRDVLLVSHGHFSRAVITRWVQLPVTEGYRFGMPTATIAICGFEHGIRQLSQLGLSCHPRPAATA
ncbi:MULTISPECIES: acid phosphatase [Mycobacterium]|uniref:Acid phosphatase n=1 Tax=Mycobacterium kiyosense TaxID=2871094 RepID=A0A9P3Q112_9MYCO|nr:MULTISPECIES: acid phosphatase [Mycobacterium]BDB40942.1 acid phosphatase [Mycobacterium kiyosense]BDE12739.1 acid phosphatase [Mycobacterium sp. 20KCMC460]GLB82680.1 acid phosphatase [Mycobacterium kiyosense]GLB87814.1 acid phosphatase [Mycobacterium kiyosense]GLB93971.1 acid phosphatase [Mycobacterium kiyosense]